MLLMFISFDVVYSFNDVFTDDSDINPKDVICAEPLKIPLGNCSDELIIPLPTVS